MNTANGPTDQLNQWSGQPPTRRVPEADIERLVEILEAIPARKLRSMQAHLARVWYRCGGR
jgi:hypothetical protein